MSTFLLRCGEGRAVKVSLVLDLLGIAAITAGAFLFSTIAGLVVLGFGLLAVSFLSERDS